MSRSDAVAVVAAALFAVFLAADGAYGTSLRSAFVLPNPVVVSKSPSPTNAGTVFNLTGEPWFRRV